MANKYQSLSKFLQNLADTKQSITLSFLDIENIIGSKLPASAYNHRGWWANLTDTTNYSYTRAWMENGFSAKIIEQNKNDGLVIFNRNHTYQPELPYEKFTLSGEVAIELWKLGRDEWNRWVKANYNANIDLVKFPFNHTDQRISFEGYNFPAGEVDFSYTNFGNNFVDFSNANFKDSTAIFDSVHFGKGVSFKGAKFRKGIVSFNSTKFGSGDVDFTNIEPNVSKFNFSDIQFDNDSFFPQRMNFENSDFEANDFSKLSLANSNFRNSNLEFANFSKTDLTFANLTRSKLNCAKFIETNFKSAKLNNANVKTSSKGINTDLSLAINLTQEQVNSMLGDTGTLLPSGLLHPSHWVEWGEEDNNQVNKSSPSVLLSYSYNDREIIDRIKLTLIESGINVDLEAYGVGNLWDGKNDTEFKDRINKVSVVTAFWSKNARHSLPLLEEAATAELNNKLIHSRLDDHNFPEEFNIDVGFDLSNWNGTANDPNMRLLIQAIKDKLHPPTKNNIKNRLISSTKVAAVEENGLIGAADTPVNAKPIEFNPDDLSIRIEAQTDFTQKIIDDFNRDRPNVDERVKFNIEYYFKVISKSRPSWYGLSDAMGSINDITAKQDTDGWSGSTLSDIQTLIRRNAELRIYIEPEQIPLDNENAPLPEPEFEESQNLKVEAKPVLAELNKVTKDEALMSNFSVSGDDFMQHEQLMLERGVNDIDFSPDGEKKSSKLISKSLKALAGFIGTLLSSAFFEALKSTSSGHALVMALTRIMEMILSKF